MPSTMRNGNVAPVSSSASLFGSALKAAVTTRRSGDMSDAPRRRSRPSLSVPDAHVKECTCYVEEPLQIGKSKLVEMIKREKVHVSSRDSKRTLARVCRRYTAYASPGDTPTRRWGVKFLHFN
jgi:hypothetical protein